MRIVRFGCQYLPRTQVLNVRLERQKITRKIVQLKKQLDACSDKSEKKRLKKTLLNLRVDLNYIQVDIQAYELDI